ncbi:hypothetical protein ACIPWI_03690 [Streptomyces sp. NPDC090046]|uniref:hypothetical protein n=1 Tax=Streptomyces sp. NPDC090046 TaxID=3365928 RepID=UPI0038045045
MSEPSARARSAVACGVISAIRSGVRSDGDQDPQAAAHDGDLALWRWRHIDSTANSCAARPRSTTTRWWGSARRSRTTLPGIASLDALRTARHTDPTFPKYVAKRGSAFLYRVGDLKKWVRNRPRAASGTTDLD